MLSATRSGGLCRRPVDCDCDVNDTRMTTSRSKQIGFMSFLHLQAPGLPLDMPFGPGSVEQMDSKARLPSRQTPNPAQSASLKGAKTKPRADPAAEAECRAAGISHRIADGRR